LTSTKWLFRSKSHKHSIPRFEKKIYKFMVGKAWRQSEEFLLMCKYFRAIVDGTIRGTMFERRMKFHFCKDLVTCVTAQLEQKFGNPRHFRMMKIQEFGGYEKLCNAVYLDLLLRELPHVLKDTPVDWKIRNTLRTHIRDACSSVSEYKFCYIDVPPVRQC